ncbi:MAG: hypothetical protein QNJ05_11630 [Woeseiaceae bacterium]|nr:hypothetical protein [Woeseiaceae bacterium]
MLGVISGAAIAIVLLIWFVGIPQFTAERPAPAVAPPLVDAVDAEQVEGIAADTEARPPFGQDDDVDAGSDLPALLEEPALAQSGDAPIVDPTNPGDIDVDPIDDADRHRNSVATGFAAGAADASTNHSPARLDPEPQWFAFWSPFRSRVAAEGFVSQLQRMTGLDYRVVKLKPGVYEVAFAYSNNDEIDLNLSTISAATGLELPGQP